MLDWTALTRALRHRNYRLFFAGQGTSLIGTWMTRVALSWWVYRLTNSTVILGLVAFAGQIPTFLLAPVGGVLVDRYNRHRVLLATQVLAMLQSSLLAALAFSGSTSVRAIMALAIFQGLINAVDTPARQALVVEMVETREDLPNAIALNSAMVNGARLIGPSVAGVLIAAFGEAGCFSIDALSYAAVILSLLAMRIAPKPRAHGSSRVWEELTAGLRYATESPPIRSILLLVAVVSLAGVPYTVLMPVFAVQILEGGPHTLGSLMTASGVGAVVGGLWLASRPSVLGLGRVITVAAGVFGVALVLFAFSRNQWLSMALLGVVGGAMLIQMAASNTVLQTIVDENKRGRIMSIYTMAFFGMVPFGSLLGGVLSEAIGAPLTIAAGGVLTLLAGLVFWRKLPELRRQVRPIYARLGVIPEIASGLNTSAELLGPQER
jgi:MFS family permease